MSQKVLKIISTRRARRKISNDAKIISNEVCMQKLWLVKVQVNQGKSQPWRDTWQARRETRGRIIGCQVEALGIDKWYMTQNSCNSSGFIRCWQVALERANERSSRGDLPLVHMVQVI